MCMHVVWLSWLKTFEVNWSVFMAACNDSGGLILVISFGIMFQMWMAWGIKLICHRI